MLWRGIPCYCSSLSKCCRVPPAPQLRVDEDIPLLCLGPTPQLIKEMRCVCARVCMCVCVLVRVEVCVHTRVCVCACVYMRACVDMHVCVRMCGFVCVCVFVCVRMCVDVLHLLVFLRVE